MEPEKLIDVFIQNIQWKRVLTKNLSIQLKSIGKPIFTKKIEDRYGRVWTHSRWWVAFDQSSLTQYCLPHPQGSACIVYLLPSLYDGVLDINIQNELELYTNS